MSPWFKLMTAMAALMLMILPATTYGDEPAAVHDYQFDPSQAHDYGRLKPTLDPDRPLHPYSIEVSQQRQALRMPTSGLIASPPEYAPTKGVIFNYGNGWTATVKDCVVALTADPLHDEIAYVVVGSSSIISSASNYFQSNGADLSKVEFIVVPDDSIWLRDYGPHFIFQGDVRAIVDSHYYPTRPQDNFIPTLLADDYFEMPSYDIGLYYSGGNFQPGPEHQGFVTSLMNLDNPEMSDMFIGQLLQDYQGIDNLHIMPQMPWSVDGTGHLDMWMYLVDEDTVIVSEFIPGSNPTAIQITNNAVPYMENLGFEVFRPPAHNSGGVHYTYTNAFRVNNRIFIPIYPNGGSAYQQRDTQAIAVWEAAVANEDPAVEIIPINCWNIIPAAGAIHCIVMQVPAYTAPVPAAHVVAPDGGELFLAGNAYDLDWAADDDQDVTGIDLYYSTDGGSTFPYTISQGLSDDGNYRWTVPDTASNEAVLKVVAHDADANSTEAISETTFDISNAQQTVYDFSTNAGLDRWAWGTQTASWNSGIHANQHPVISELSSTNYDRIATSNATGGDSDTGRYITSYPSSGFESTHVFEFTIYEDPAEILEIAVDWEGYGDDCTQMEMYLWDLSYNNWGNNIGRGQNFFTDNFAGNRDAVLTARIQSNIEKFIDDNGILTILLYAERASDRSFHDYMGVTIAYGAPPQPADLNDDGVVDAADLALLLGNWGPCAGCPQDIDGNGEVDAADLALLLGAWS